ncbi:glycosyl transferase group 1 [Planctomycetales bacterium]|nr:glycosyl transferase group 1 [Planctomycetales bacterium]
MEPIRILYLIDALNSALAGSEQHLLWLLKNNSAMKLEKHFIILSHFGHPGTFDPSVFPQREPLVLTEKFGFGKISWFKQVRFLRQYIKEHNIQIIQAFNSIAELTAAVAACTSRRCKVVGNRRDCGYDRRATYRWIHWSENFFNMQYIANSEAARQAAFRNDKTPLNSITVIRNPISFERIQTGITEPLTRKDLPISNLPDNAKIVGMVATVRPIKDYATLIKAAARVLQNVPEALFVFVGEQEHQHTEELKQLTEQCGVADKIIWYGGINNPFRIVPLFDVAVLSTHSESFSNAVLEYAVAERPIVVSDVGGLGEIVQDGKSGFLVPPKNSDALAEKVVWFLQNPESAAVFGKNAGSFVREQYDEQKILRQYTDFYRGLC